MDTSLIYDHDHFPIGDISTMVDMDTSSLLDDEQFFSLKKIQVTEYDIDNFHHDTEQGLFPDLLPLEDDTDPLSLEWMENVDLTEELLEKAALPEVQEGTTPEEGRLLVKFSVQQENIDLLKSLLQDTSDQLTPPSSPPAQVAPEIDLSDVTVDHQTLWEIINSPLSPQDVEDLLSPSSGTSSLSVSPSVSPPDSPVHNHELHTIDTSSIQSDQTATISPKGRPKPYERTSKRRATSVVRELVEDESELDFSFRSSEKLSKRERKKLQNKNAATKYRQKKKMEASQISSEEQELEDKNRELKDKVEQLTREISCMKEVLGDIYKGLEAKGKRT